MKKCIAILLAGMMILSCACSKTKETTKETTTSATTTESETDASESDSGEPSDLLTGKFDADPRDPNTGDYKLVKAIKSRNIEMEDFITNQKGGLSAIADQPAPGADAKFHAEFKAQKDSKLTLYLMPESSDCRWMISKALGSQTLDIKASDTTADFTIAIPEDLETNTYDFIFVEDGEVIAYFKKDIAKKGSDIQPH